MSVYVDTSAFYAVLDRDDLHHDEAQKTWQDLLRGNELLLCSSYVLLESYALIQKRLGLDALKAFHEAVYPLLTVEWIGADVLEGAVNAIFIAQKRLSIVDCTSFAVMRRLGVRTAFTFDQHFQEQGFTCIPNPTV